jgi:serine/threonine protein kinase
MEIPGFRIERMIGRGGMAAAYLATQESLGRPVVLKILKISGQIAPETIERFLLEGRIVASLHHPNIITIFDIGSTEELVYHSMEYVEGGDLRTQMRKSIPPERALDIIIKVGTALAAAHQSGVVHRDVKPANILFRRDGTPLLSDFGIAKQLIGDPELTSTGIFLGSPNYMAPEQAEGGVIDGRADLYSLGVIFYEMLTGMKPFLADTVVELIMMHKQAPVPKLPGEMAVYQPLLNQLLAKKPENRFRDANTFVRYTVDLVQGQVRKAASTTGPGLIRRAGKKSGTGQNKGPPEKSAHASNRKQIALIAVLTLTSIGFASLYGVEWYLNHANRLTRTPSLSGPATPGPGGRNPGIAPPLTSNPTAGVAGNEVVNALAHLARYSLETDRLTEPPQQNAYYYYSRLLEVAPAHQEARLMLQQIPERCARKAEFELANNHPAQALNYIYQGLRADPSNTRLLELQNLAQISQRSFFQRIAEYFKAG